MKFTVISNRFSRLSYSETRYLCLKIASKKIGKTTSEKLIEEAEKLWNYVSNGKKQQLDYEDKI